MSATILLKDAADARAWISDLPTVSRETVEQLDAFVALLRAANREQNLIAASTADDSIWTRHIADSAQLLPLAPQAGAWIDLGSGPGLPGMVIAICDPARRVTLVESRRRRCQFLHDAIVTLNLGGRVELFEGRVEAVPRRSFSVISARAFAPLPRLIATSHHLAGQNTRWLLPKGENAVNELSTIPPSWQKRFEAVPSLTSAAAHILIGRGDFAD